MFDLISFLFNPGLPWWLTCKESACNAGDPGSISVGRSRGVGQWQPTPGFLTGELHEQRSLVSYSPLVT